MPFKNYPRPCNVCGRIDYGESTMTEHTLQKHPSYVQDDDGNWSGNWGWWAQLWRVKG